MVISHSETLHNNLKKFKDGLLLDLGISSE